MKTNLKRWIATPALLLILSPLLAVTNLAQAATPCDIETGQVTYQSGETVQLTVFRLTNSAAVSQFYEWKLWLKSPLLGDQSLVNMGADQSLALPAGFDFDFAGAFGPITLFTLDDVIYPSGTYEIGCRLLNPITGEEYSDADVITFNVP